MTKLARPIFFREIRFFELADTDKAWDWIKEGL